MHVFYLHGFASSALSKKAAFFASRLAPYGLALHCPDFNEPDFATLTVSRMIAQVAARLAALPPGPVALIGSSMGGLVLLAPAFEFAANRMRSLVGDHLDEWKASDQLEVFHYGFGKPMTVGYALYEDALQYDSDALESWQPTVVFQGSRDESVDPASVVQWSRCRPNVTLHLLDDDHQLIGSLDRIWEETARFLGLPRRR
jgi:hypothetical protein